MKKLMLTLAALLAGVASTYAIDDNTVEVVYNGTTATVTTASNIASYITATTDGAHVSIVQSSDVSASTCGEITYILSGASTDGAFYMEGSFKASVTLNGLTLTNPSGAAIDIQNGKRIAVSIKNGTTNTLTDGTGGDWKGCYVCKGHSEFKGKGTLNVYGNTAHGIWSKEYIEVKNCTINVLAAVKDGINCNQYFLMESGTVAISGVGDDGIQVSLKDDGTDEEDTGNFTQNDGTLTIKLTGDGEYVKAEGTITYNGGAHTFSGKTTGISSVLSDGVSLQTAETIYDLSGRQTPKDATLPKGLYILKSGNKTTKIQIR